MHDERDALVLTVVAHERCYHTILLIGASGKDYVDRIWSHAVRSQKLFTSSSGIDTGPYYVASGVWGKCPLGGVGNQWTIARVGVNAHELCHNLGVSKTNVVSGNITSETIANIASCIIIAS